MKNNLKVSIVILILIIIGLIIYYQKSPNIEAPVDTGTVATENSVIGCYVATLSKDVYSLSINTQKGDTVEGTLVFKNFDKDSSSGTFKGTFKNGILLGDYTFESEGMSSVSQVIFKQSGTDFIRGYGDLNADGTRFADLNAITYDTQAVFKKTTDVCAKPTASTVAPTTVVGVGETRTIEGVTVKVNKMVTDSRCPTDVVCIQAGSVTMNVTLKNGTTIKTVDLTSGKAYMFAGYSISITNVTPVRVSTQTPNPNSYQTTFIVKK